jgi:hypothetical protein
MPAGSHRAGMTAYQPLRIVYFAGNEIHYCKFNQQALGSGLKAIHFLINFYSSGVVKVEWFTINNAQSASSTAPPVSSHPAW